MQEKVSNIPLHVSKCLQLALLLEVSAYPKPGNVHRNADFNDTRYEHFLASAVAVAPYFELSAKKGVLILLEGFLKAK
jgi:triphosphoribosyl-dephospho-CoA synthetase